MRVLAICCIWLCMLTVLGCGSSITLGTDEDDFDATIYVGNWTGPWQSLLAGRQGTAVLLFRADQVAKTFEVTFDMDGEVLDGLDPPQVVFEGTYTTAGGAADVPGTAFGDVTMTIGRNGAFSGAFENVPHPDIDRINFTGSASANSITINFTVLLNGGGFVNGTMTLTR